MGELEKYLVPVNRGNPCQTCAMPILDCPWLREEAPVLGWDAEKRWFVVGRYSGGRNHWVETYVIHQCPLYIPAKQRRTSRRERK